MVMMPGAMADLAHSVQRVNTSVANANADDKQTDNEEVEVVDKTEEEPQEEVQQAVEQVENERPTVLPLPL